jgi:hypothetical protein
MAHEQPQSMLVFFPHPQPVGELPQWPLHMTILPWTNVSPEKFILFTRENVHADDVLPIEVVGTAMFGHPEQGHMPMTVNLIEPADNLQAFHERFFRRFGRLLLENRGESGEGYRPHITRKKGQKNLEMGDTFLFDAVSVVSWIDGKRMIVATIPFVGQSA